MTQSTQPISPLRQRMIDDMRLRKLSPKTQTGYIRAVKRLAGFLGRSPDSATAEDLRHFQLHLVDHGISPVSLNATITGLRFFFEVTLERADLMARMSTVAVPRKLTVVLSRDEVSRLIASAGHLKYQAALSVAYGAGQLKFFGEYTALTETTAFANWLKPLRRIEWVVYAKRPFAGPAAVLAYLARYTHRVAIANSRLIALDERGVTFQWLSLIHI